MKISKIIFFLIVSIAIGCKQGQEVKEVKTVQSVPKIITEVPVSPMLKELVKFADLEILDSIAVNQLFLYKEVDKNGVVKKVDENASIGGYKKIMRRKATNSFPIFEIKNTDTAILFVQGIGFGGAIWAKVLVDTKSLEIKKIEFDHKAESDGYGAAMTQSSFEDKFVGAKIDLKENTFTLQKNMEKRIDDGTIVDGISGATMTSKAALEMVNEGLKQYNGYLNP